MEDREEPREQLLLEVGELRRRVVELEASTVELAGSNQRLRAEVAECRRVEGEIRHRLEAATLLQRASGLIASASDMTEALQRVCSELAGLLGVPQAGFALLSPDRSSAEVIADVHPPQSPSAIGTIIPVADNPSMAYVLEKSAPLAVSEAQVDPLLGPVHDIMRRRKVQSILIVPVIADGAVIGTMGFDAFEPRVFGEADIQLVQHVANQMGQLLLRKRAERARLESERRLSAILSSMIDHVFAFDEEGRFTFYHAPSSEDQYAAPSSLLGKKYSQVMPAHLSELFRQAFEENRQGSAAKYEYWIDIDGQTKWYSVNLSPSFVEGEFRGSVAVARDITERAWMEGVLRRYAERLEMLQQVGRAILDAQSAEAIARATLARIGHLVPFQRASILAFGPEKVPRALAVHVNEGASRHEAGPRRGVSAAGREAAHDEGSSLGIPLMAQGELVGILRLTSVDRDAFSPEHIEIAYEVAAPLAVAIQHARLNEQLRVYAGSLEETVAQRTRELRAERDRTQAILESLGEAVIVTDAEGTILYTNPATTALTGLQGKELLGQNWRRLQGDGQADEAYALAEHAMRAGQPWRSEASGWRKNDVPYDAAVTVTPLFDPDEAGQLVGSVWVQRDITPLKEAERFKDQFISNVSHELRTPLSIITLLIGNLDRLYQRLEDARRREMIRDVREHVGVLNELVGDVLEISRIDSGRVSREREEVDLTQLVREELAKQQPLASKKLQRLEITGISSLALQGNEGQLRQIVRNILNNAIKFTPTGGKITCTCWRGPGERGWDSGWPGTAGLSAGQWAAFRVVDNGIGIKPDDIAHLFERFYRVEAQGDVPGTGLGLAITRELVELHGGQIAVESTPGKGSIFAVYLPCVEEE